MTAKLIILDGPDGSGKSLACKNLAEFLVTPQCVVDQSVAPWKVTSVDKVKILRDPGTTALGEKLREILLDPTQKAEVPTLFFGFLAARAEIMAEAAGLLSHGYTVIMDRLWPSTVAYQGYGHGVPLQLITSTALYLFNNYISVAQHIHYVFLRASLEVRRSRLVGERGKDRFEDVDDNFRRRVDNGYLGAEQIAFEIHNRSGHSFTTSVLDVSAASPREVVEKIYETLPSQWLDEFKEVR